MLYIHISLYNYILFKLDEISIKDSTLSFRKNSLSEATKVGYDSEDEYSSLLHEHENEGIIL